MYFLNVIVSALFECTAEENGLVSTPNIPDSYFNHSRAGELRTQHIPTLMQTTAGFTYVFTVPSVGTQRNCSGNVMALEYCYEAGNEDVGMKRDLFYFLSLTRNTGAHDFRVDGKFLVEVTPMESSCTPDLPSGGVMRICCGQYTLEPPNRIAISSAPFSFGIVIRDLKLLAVSFRETEFNFPQFQLSLGESGPSVGGTFSVGSQLTGHSLLLQRFIIGILLMHAL